MNHFKTYIQILLIFLSGLLYSQSKGIRKLPNNDPEADKQLAAIKATFDSYKSYKISFDITNMASDGKIVEKSSGIHLANARNFYTKIATFIIISDGVSIWNINQKSKTIAISENTTKSNKNQSPLDFIKNYKLLYKYRIKETIKRDNIIELVPLSKNNQFFKIDITSNTKNHLISEVKLYDRSGDKIVYTITKTEPNPTLNPGVFSPSKESFKGYEISDLRD